MNALASLIFHIKNLLLFFYPPHCTSCGIQITQEELFCKPCFESIKPIASLCIPITDSHSLTVHAAARYDNPLRLLILKKHYTDAYASYQLGNVMAQTLNLALLKADFLVPTPLHWTRYAIRGFNQAEIIANILPKKMNIPVLKLCIRVHKTDFQAALTVEERVANVRHVFAVAQAYKDKIKELVAGKHIVFVDDLYTTGSTLKSLARTITHYKPAKLSALVACRVP